MNRKERPFVVWSILAASLLGGMISWCVFRVDDAFSAKVSGDPKVISAQEFRLVDTEAKTRAKLCMLSGGSPGLVLLDEDGKPRATLDISSGNATLALYDKDGNIRILLGMTPHGKPALVIQSEKEQPRACLVLDAGAPLLFFRNKADKLCASLDLSSDEGASLILWGRGKDGGSKAMFTPSYLVLKKDKDTLWEAP